MKAIEMEGEKRGRIELGEEEEAEGFDRDTPTRDEHEGEIVTKGNQIFIQNILRFPLQFVSFIEERKDREVATKRRLGDRNCCGGYASSLWTSL